MPRPVACRTVPDTSTVSEAGALHHGAFRQQDIEPAPPQIVRELLHASEGSR